MLQLDLCANDIGAAGFAALAGGLIALTALTELDLACNEPGCAGAAALAAVLPRLPRLAQLDLSGYDDHDCHEDLSALVGDAGAIAIAGALSELPAIMMLDLNCNQIGVEGVRALADGPCCARRPSASACSLWCAERSR